MARVLLVDDDPAQLAIRKLLVERAGHTADTALTAAAARERFHGALPDIVVLDLGLPEVEDGLALIGEFREARPGVRMIVLSGYTEVDWQGKREMVDEVLTKPIRSERLLALLR